jgi:hypothetical protein
VFIEHGDTDTLRARYGLSAAGIADVVRAHVEESRERHGLAAPMSPAPEHRQQAS